jgi:pilus assembly protein Flp/PilA
MAVGIAPAPAWHKSAIRGTRVPLGAACIDGNLITHDGDLRLNLAHFARPEIGDKIVIARIRQIWTEEDGQDVAEYAVMLAVILVIVIGTVRLIGTSANTVFSQVGSSLAQ